MLGQRHLGATVPASGEEYPRAGALGAGVRAVELWQSIVTRRVEGEVGAVRRAMPGAVLGASRGALLGRCWGHRVREAAPAASRARALAQQPLEAGTVAALARAGEAVALTMQLPQLWDGAGLPKQWEMPRLGGLMVRTEGLVVARGVRALGRAGSHISKLGELACMGFADTHALG